MSRILRLSPGDRVLLKKPHPCGSREWEIIRAGADVRAKCMGCGRVALLPSVKFERRVREFTLRVDETDQHDTQEA